MGNKSAPPANDQNKVKGIKREKDFPEQKRFTDADRKRNESDDHTVGGF